MAVEKKPQIEVLPRYEQDGTFTEQNADMCVVLHGYGRLATDDVHYIDNYKFVGGVGRNIPRSVANAWKKGIRPDGKPAVSRVYPQAILPSDASDVDFASACGIAPMEPARLAAMIDATDAATLVQALGRSKAVALAEQLLKDSAKAS
jgi:hypothetical protein